jgi:hypothetical protein
MRLLALLLLSWPARADVSLHQALLGERGFADSIAPIAVSPGNNWLAVIDRSESCCIESTLSLHVLTESGKTVTDIPFACADGTDACQTQLDRPRALRFLRRHRFVVPGDAVSLPYSEEGEARPFHWGGYTFTWNHEELIITQGNHEVQHIDRRVGYAILLPSKKLLVYYWFNPNDPESDEMYRPPYSGIELVHLR